MLKNSKLTAVLALALLSATSAMASDISVGAYGGTSFVNNNVGTKANFGVDGTYKVMPMINVGARVGYLPLGDMGTAGYSNNVLTILGQANYVFDGALDGLHAGLQAGIGSTSSSGTNSGVSYSSSSTNLAWGPAAGYDYRIAPNFTAGLDLAYLIVSQPSTLTATVGGSTVTQTNTVSSYGFFNTVVTLKYWF